MAVTETITEILQLISETQYGRDMREAIRKGIEKCYEDGRAGSTDLEARQALEEVQDNFTAINEWYKLPMTRSDRISGAGKFISENLIINPALKLMELKFNVGLSDNGSSQSLGTILTGLPILSYFTNISQTYQMSERSRRFIALSKYAGNPDLNVLECRVYNTDDNLGDNPSTVTQSVVQVLGNLPDNSQVSGSIILPYKELSAAHPFSEATLITS